MPKDIEIEWKKWFDGVKKLVDFEFDRCIIPKNDYKSVELRTYPRQLR